jgi:pimeloyl-ACP methyl ester carboxylesterase
LRGFGDSDKPCDGYDYDTMADDVYAVFESLNVQNSILVGFSMGGAIAIHYIARHHAKGVSKLVLLGAAAPCFTKREDFPFGIDKATVDDLIQQTYRDRSSMLKNFTEIFFANPEKLSPEFKIWNLSLGLAASAHATIQCAIELKDADLRSDLAMIIVPTLIVHGTSDNVCLLDLAKFMHDNIKGSRFIPVEKAEHGFYYEEKEKLNSELLNFIT